MEPSTAHGQDKDSARTNPEESAWEYSGLVAESFDLWFGEDPFADQGYYARRISEGDGPALELGSGTGRLLLPYLREGLTVEGVDASSDMLAICRGKAAAIPLEPCCTAKRCNRWSFPHASRPSTSPSAVFKSSPGPERVPPHCNASPTTCDPEVASSSPSPWRASTPTRSPTGPAAAMDVSPATAPPSRSTPAAATTASRNSCTPTYATKPNATAAPRSPSQDPCASATTPPPEFRLLLQQAGFSDITVHGKHTEEPLHKGHHIAVFGATAPG